jgi:lipopolysaccharide transport system permease protein
MPQPYFVHAALMVRSLIRHRRLAWELAKRELVDRYVGQVGGTLWSIVQPALMIGIFILLFAGVFTTRLVTSSGSPKQQIVYLLAGLVPWMTIQDALARAPTVITSNAALVKQVSFPLTVLPVKTLLPSYIMLPIGYGLLFLYVLFSEGTLSLSWGLLPVCWVMLAVFTIGLAYCLSAITVYLRDAANVLQLVLFAGLYVSPVFYAPEAAPRLLRVAIYVNPFTYLILCFQDVTYYGYIAHPMAWVAATGLSALAFLVGARVFNVLQRYFGSFL